MNKIINKQILEKLAALAKIEIKKEKEEKLTDDLEKILDHFKELENINTENIQSLNGGTELINITKSDNIENVDKETINDDLIGQFFEKESNLLKIPPVFE